MTADEALQTIAAHGYATDRESVLAAEVRRLRAENQSILVETGKMRDESAKIARVEALLERWRASANMLGADELEAALRDPQPSAAPKCWNHVRGCKGASNKGVNVFCDECRERLEATGFSWPACEHTWVSYSEPPMRAVTGLQCTKCKVIKQKPQEPYNGW